MNCKDVQSRLQLLIDRQLGEAESQQIHGHLMNCPSCSAMKHDFELLTELTHSQLSVKAPENFDSMLRQRLEARNLHRPGTPRIPQSFAWSAAAVFFLVLFVFTTIFFNQSRKSSYRLSSQTGVTPVVLPADPGTPGTHVFVPGEKRGMLLQVPVTVKLTRRQLTQDFFLSEVSH